MGELLRFPLHRAERLRAGGLGSESPPTFFFDVSCPLSYLAAERVERALGTVEWAAVDSFALRDRTPTRAELATLRAHAEARARALRLPLVWPEGGPASRRGALRAAAFACELGAGAAFALAAGRLAFCGGFDLDDPETLAEAAAAAAVPLGACLEAVGERWRDEELRDTARVLRAHGVDRLPALAIGRRWLGGEVALATAAALLHEAGRAQRPLAPVG